MYELAIEFNPERIRQYGFVFSDTFSVFEKLKSVLKSSCDAGQPRHPLRFVVNSNQHVTEVVSDFMSSVQDNVHINQTSPRCLVWGAVNKKDRMEYRFPATVHLQPFLPVSQALVGRIPWDHPSAFREAQVLLRNEYGGLTKFFKLLLMKAILTVQAQKEYAQNLRSFPFPPGWARPQSLLRHLNSYRSQEHAR